MPANYAVRMLRPIWQNEPLAIEMFRTEALLGQKVSHPHLAPVLAAYVVEPPRMLVMPWLDGASLAKHLSLGRRFDLPQALWIARQTAEALDALFTAGWIHGDVSPGNIHLAPNGHVTLLDLSFARPKGAAHSAVDRVVMGTCNYVAPEQLRSKLAADIRSDIYSLGAVLYELLSGRPPYIARDLAELASLHLQSSPPDLGRLAPDLPREILGLVRRMIAKDPLRRPQTPRELVRELAALEIGVFSQRAL